MANMITCKIVPLVAISILLCHGGQLQKREGFWYITGKGCGTDTEIKYLNDIPDQIEGLSCVIIKPKSISNTDLLDENSVLKDCPFGPYMKKDIMGGNGHQTILNVASASDCRKLCYDHPSCEAFIYVTDGEPLANGAAGKGCHLKWQDGSPLEFLDEINVRLLSGYKNCKAPEG